MSLLGVALGEAITLEALEDIRRQEKRAIKKVRSSKTRKSKPRRK